MGERSPRRAGRPLLRLWRQQSLSSGRSRRAAKSACRPGLPVRVKVHTNFFRVKPTPVERSALPQEGTVSK